MGEPESTAVQHAEISDLTSVLTGGEISLSNFGESMTTPSMQLRMKAMDSELISDSTQTSDRDEEALLHVGEQPIAPIAQAILGTTAVDSG